MFAEENGLKGDPRLQHISQSIRVVPHFPKNGFFFKKKFIYFILNRTMFYSYSFYLKSTDLQLCIFYFIKNGSVVYYDFILSLLDLDY
jgi:hypothetical protein